MLRSLAVVLSLGSLFAIACSETDDVQSPGPAPNDTSLYDNLVASAVPVPSVIDVDEDLLPAADPTDPRQGVGGVLPVGARVDLTGLRAGDLSSQPVLVAEGAIRSLDNGFVWSAEIEARDASALRLNLTDFALPDGAELYLYSSRGDAVGPYTGTGPLATGEFWTNSVRGERVSLQLRYHGNDVQAALAAVDFTIADAGYFDQRYLLARYGADDASDRAFCSFNASCVENEDCLGPYPTALAEARKAIAHYTFIERPYMYMCTGGLIADTDTSTEIPYFLTANHCVSKNRVAQTVETYFNFTTPCGGSCYSPTARGTLGAQVVSSSTTSDHSLLRLGQTPPSGTSYLPFNADPVASGSSTLYRFSHPKGAPLAYSEQTVDPTSSGCFTLPRGEFIYSRGISGLGTTEGGSSGSPVLNANGEVVGQLYGKCGSNLENVCDFANNLVVDGALANYYPLVAPYLDPSSSPAAEVCDNGADDDSDLLVDCADPDCAGDPACGGGGTCTLGQLGDACTSNSDCCSNKCAGKPGAKVCK